jgi:hypothetical protein
LVEKEPVHQSEDCSFTINAVFGSFPLVLTPMEERKNGVPLPPVAKSAGVLLIPEGEGETDESLHQLKASDEAAMCVIWRVWRGWVDEGFILFVTSWICRPESRISRVLELASQLMVLLVELVMVMR